MFKKLAGLFVVVIAGLFWFGAASAEIANSVHDFSDELAGSDSWNTSGEICVVCHTTHNTDITVSDAPLWNHDLTTQSFTVYVGVDMDNTVPQPDGISKLCLSCHDGVTALDAFGGNTGTTNIGAAYGPDADFGIDLRDDHPISMVMNNLSDTDLNDPAGLSLAQLFNLGTTVECASCHEVHNENPALDSLLIADNAGSALCLDCHGK